MPKTEQKRKNFFKVMKKIGENFLFCGKFKLNANEILDLLWLLANNVTLKRQETYHARSSDALLTYRASESCYKKLWGENPDSFR